MDRAYIESNAIMQRYLAGSLSEEESLAFEQACAADASLADELNRDLMLKAGLETLAQRGKLPAPARQRRAFAVPYAAAASVVALTALGASGYLAWRVQRQQDELQAAHAPQLIGRTEHLVPLRGEPLDVPLPRTGRLGLSVDAALFSGMDVDIELRTDAGNPLWQRAHRVADEGTVLIAIDPATVPPGDYSLRIVPRDASAPLVYRLRLVPIVDR